MYCLVCVAMSLQLGRRKLLNIRGLVLLPQNNYRALWNLIPPNVLWCLFCGRRFFWSYLPAFCRVHESPAQRSTYSSEGGMFELRKSFAWIPEACAPKGAALVNKRTEVPRNDCFDSVLKSMNPKVKILVDRKGPLSRPPKKNKHNKKNGKRRKQKAGGKKKRALQSGLRKKAKVVMCEIRVRLVGVSSKGSGCALGGRTRPTVASLFVLLSAFCLPIVLPFCASVFCSRRLRLVPPPPPPMPCTPPPPPAFCPPPFPLGAPASGLCLALPLGASAWCHSLVFRQ